jgi:hypothetical protein
MIAYSELSGRLRTIVLPYDDPAMGKMLEEISTEEFQNGRGMLSVVVVHRLGDMEPGTGFYTLAEKLGRKFSDQQAFWISELHRVHDTWANEPKQAPSIGR